MNSVAPIPSYLGLYYGSIVRRGRKIEKETPTLSWNPMIYPFFAFLGVIPAIVFTSLLPILVLLGVMWGPFHRILQVAGSLYVFKK